MAFYFAWVDPGETSFDLSHHREDESVLSFWVEQNEGDFASLSIEIKNPGTGLLSVARKRWAWLAYDDGSSVTPLFFGRVVGVPEGQESEVLRLTLVARPADYRDRKATLAASLRVLPWFDRVWLAPDQWADDDAVLEARSALYHIDRVSHAVTISDVLEGEDGTAAIAGNHFYDALAVQYLSAPVARVAVSAQIAWDQRASGVVDVSRAITDAAAAAGTSRINVISSYTGEGMLRDWPSAGTPIGGGWSVSYVFNQRLDGIYIAREGSIANTSKTSRIYFPLWTVSPTFEVAFSATRRRIERVSFEMRADLQAVIADTLDESDEIRLTISSEAAADDLEGEVPIEDVRRRSYLQTDRGRQSIEYLALLARARLRAQARVVEIQAGIPFDEAIALSCRKSASLSDARLPGGAATGKVTGYGFGINGDDGALEGAVTIACAVGNGGAFVAVPGASGYVAAGYAVEGVFAYGTGDAALPSGDAGVPYFGAIEAADDGLNLLQPLQRGDVVLSAQVTNGQAAQEVVISTAAVDAAAAITNLNNAATRVTLQMRPIDGLTFATDYDLGALDLVVPSLIDLEAS